jgi:glycine/D-amino acid oxidase-like deaminating enzyme
MVTKPKDLRTGECIWDAPRERGVPHTALTADTKVNVLMIGAGITGAIIAEALSTAGHEVIVVDKGGVAKASTALVQHEIDTPLSQLVRKIGKPAAIRAWRRSRLAVDALASRLQELQPREVVPRATLFLEGNRLDAKGLRREQVARQEAGLPSTFLDHASVHSRFGISRRTALLIHGDFVLNPRKTTLAFLRAAVMKSARTFCPVEIIGLEPRRTGVVAITREGHRITARYQGACPEVATR